jgi:alkylhydroperoxidase/carboxymuconolactone decarboxylase family protein YurZ
VGSVRTEHEDLLRRLALNDEDAAGRVLGSSIGAGAPGLDDRTRALVRLAGLVAVASTPASYEWAVSAAVAAGASDDEIVGVVAALAPIVGTARTSAAAAGIAASQGYELGRGDPADPRRSAGLAALAGPAAARP